MSLAASELVAPVQVVDEPWASDAGVLSSGELVAVLWSSYAMQVQKVEFVLVITIVVPPPAILTP